MNHSYEDIRSRIISADGEMEEPTWWDEAAVPRYCRFGPQQVADIYADEAALVLIACQACEREFRVAISHGFNRSAPPLCDRIAKKVLYYGDPPNVHCCPAGPTMSSEPIRVLEYWARDKKGTWVRDYAYERQCAPVEGPDEGDVT